MRLIAAILFLLNQLLYLGVAFIAPATAINTGKMGVGTPPLGREKSFGNTAGPRHNVLDANECE